MTVRCYLCGKKWPRLTVTSTYDQYFEVCNVCAENGNFCFGCDRPLSRTDEKYDLRGPWGQLTGDYECHNCAELRFDNYQESMVF